MPEPWQLQLFRRSLKKRQTVDALMEHLPPVQGRLCLELGCGTGLTSHFLPLACRLSPLTPASRKIAIRRLLSAASQQPLKV